MENIYEFFPLLLSQYLNKWKIFYVIVSVDGKFSIYRQVSEPETIYLYNKNNCLLIIFKQKEEC